MGAAVRLPNNGWSPRPYQLPLWRYLRSGGTLASAIWHRRAGKDDVALHHAAIASVERPAVFWHMLPKYSQARKAIWTAVNPHTGMKRIDEAFPLSMRRRTDSQTMTIETVTGSVWQVVGSDNPDSLVGSPPAGVVFSEWALSNPMTYAFLKPILDENGGWALFITTPRGRNHAVKLHQNIQKNGRGFAEVVSAEDSGRFSAEKLAEIRQEYVDDWGVDIGESLFDQEYLCDFDAPILGSYYAKLLLQAERQGRLLHGGVWDPRFPVETWWDLGISDATAIWFVQVISGQFRFIDFVTASDSGLDYYAHEIQERPYKYSRHILPHDGDARELGTGLTRVETLRRFMPGHSIVISPLQSVDDGINACRQLLPKCWFDVDLCEEGLEALRSYHREWDVDRKTFNNKPEHDWSSHCFAGETEIITRAGIVSLRDAPSTGEVLTECGWKPYRNPRVTRRDARLVEVRFEDGLSVKCTPDHMFATVNGWKSAASLRKGSRIRSSLTCLRNISMGASTASGRLSDMRAVAGGSCIATYGRRLSGRSPLAAIFTTRTATFPEIASIISNAWTRWNTRGSRGLSEILVSLWSSARLPARALRIGIGATPAAFGIDAMRSVKWPGQNGSEFLSHARFAESNIRRSSGETGISKNIAADNASLLRVASVRVLSETADVWCLTVPDVEHFSLSNGAVVHNCADAFRTGAMMWRQQFKPAKGPGKPVDRWAQASRRRSGSGWAAG